MAVHLNLPLVYGFVMLKYLSSWGSDPLDDRAMSSSKFCIYWAASIERKLWFMVLWFCFCRGRLLSSNLAAHQWKLTYCVALYGNEFACRTINSCKKKIMIRWVYVFNIILLSTMAHCFKILVLFNVVRLVFMIRWVYVYFVVLLFVLWIVPLLCYCNSGA